MDSCASIPHTSQLSFATPYHVNEQFQCLPLANFVDQYTATPMPLTVRISVLNLQFMKLLNCKVKQQVTELQKYYFLTSSDIETSRYSALQSANHYMQISVNSHYDQQHHDLITKTEYSLSLIEQRIVQTKQEHVEKHDTATNSPVPDTRKLPKTTASNTIAHRIMNNWYERNKEHPYPSYDTAEIMAKAGGITVEQVKKWFANKRLRHGNTKHITEIAKRRKRSRTVSTDDVLFSGVHLSE